MMPGLRCRVVRLAPVAVDADDRRDVDDRSRAPLHHRPRHRTARVEDRGEVRLDHGAPVLVAHPGEQAVPRQARVVDEHVDVAGRLDERARRPGSETSAWTARPPIDAATVLRLRRGPSGSPTTTEAPAAASSMAIARPIPRDAPVTSAVLPSSEQKPAHVRQRLSRLLETREIVDRDRLDAPVDALDEPGEHVARADLDERRHSVVHELARRLREPHGRRQLVDEQRREPRRRLDMRRHRRHERRDRIVESDRRRSRA